MLIPSLMHHIYLDHNATTPLKPAVYEAMVAYLKENFGNPSSIHWAGRKAKEGLMVARELVAALFHADSQEVIFTSGGTEANNLALKGTFERYKDKGQHIITTQVEHKSILECCDELRKKGALITYLSIDKNGAIDLEELKNAIRPETILLSIQAANNETGVVMPIQKISEIAKKRNILFHTDAVQIAGKFPFYVDAEGVDMMSISAHKICGPKGSGALILRKGLKLEALIHGGNQERKRRGGTENIAAIVGFGKACELAKVDLPSYIERLTHLRDDFENEIISRIPNAHIHGKESLRVPNTTHICFPGISGESLLLNLDLSGVAASLGSACSSGTLEPSHVLLAMGVSQDFAMCSIRFSLGYETQASHIEALLDLLPHLIRDLK